MASSPMAVQAVYLLSVLVAWYCLPYINWKEVRRGRYLSVLYTVALLSTVTFSSLSLLALASDCKGSAACSAGMSVLILIFDAIVTVTLEMTMIKRMEILVDPALRKYLYAFYVVPSTYPFANLITGLGNFGITFPGQVDIANIINVLVPINSLIVEMLLAYHLTHGEHTPRFSRYERRVRIILCQTVFLCLSMAGFAVFTAFIADLGYACIYVLASGAFYVIGELNRLIIAAFKGGVEITVEPTTPTAAGSTSALAKTKGMPASGSGLVLAHSKDLLPSASQTLHDPGKQHVHKDMITAHHGALHAKETSGIAAESRPTR